MLCPEGYVTIPDILDTVPDPNFEGQEPNFQLRSKKKERLVFQAILKNDALRICLPDGTILRIHDEILDMVSLSYVFLAAKIPDGSFVSLAQSNDFWASCRNRNPEIGMPLFFTRPYYVLTLENYKALKVAVDKAFPKDYNQDDIWAATGLPFEFDPMWPVVSKFEGASLCAVSDKIPENISSFSPTKRNFQKSKNGRPSFKPEIVEFYQKHYPNGNGCDSWKEVNAKLLEITGIGVHEDTIKRALGLKQ